MNSQQKITLLTLIIIFWFCPKPENPTPKTNPEFIVWNVGQGLWTTWITNDECWHFDMGGEKIKTLEKVFSLCRNKVNRVFLSHWDWDHVGFIAKAKKRDWVLCLSQSPGGQMSSVKTGLLDGLSNCPVNSKLVENLWDVTKSDPPQKTNLKNRSNNHDSHVFFIKSLGIIIPGDSTVSEEPLWSRKIHSNVTGLVLGHHGSRTSTSEQLLTKIPNLKWAIASQRFKRFHHPHPETIARLRQHHVPLLRTEDWGDIRFEL